MSEKRQRWLRLVFDLVLDIAALLFGLVGLLYLGYLYATPSLRDQPFDTSLEQYLGHTGTFLAIAAFALIMILVGAFFARQTIRLMRRVDDEP